MEAREADVQLETLKQGAHLVAHPTSSYSAFDRWIISACKIVQMIDQCAFDGVQGYGASEGRHCSSQAEKGYRDLHVNHGKD